MHEVSLNVNVERGGLGEMVTETTTSRMLDLTPESMCVFAFERC